MKHKWRSINILYQPIEIRNTKNLNSEEEQPYYIKERIRTPLKIVESQCYSLRNTKQLN